MAILAAAVTGCGVTRVKIVNNTSQTFTAIAVRATLDTATQATFGTVAIGATSEEKEWPSDTRLLVGVATTPSTTDQTAGVTLTVGKVNTLTLSNGTVPTEDITYTISAQ